jgi:hypothetical protein
MEVYCDCGEEMQIESVEPDQRGNNVLFECPECGASLSGYHEFGEE